MGRAMNKVDFQNLLNFFSNFNFGDNPKYKYRISLIIFTVSHDLRPAVGFEAPLDKYCLENETCKFKLDEFFRKNNLNLKFDTQLIPIIYNTNYSIESLDRQVNEDEVHWYGRLFGYWEPMTEIEFGNHNVDKYSLSMEIYYGDEWNWNTAFDSLKPININIDRLNKIRSSFDIIKIGKNCIKISLLYRQGQKEGEEFHEQVLVSCINF